MRKILVQIVPLLFVLTIPPKVFAQGKIVKYSFNKSTAQPIPGSFLVEFTQNPQIKESRVQGVSSNDLSTMVKKKVFVSQKYPEITQKLETLKARTVEELPMANNNVVKMIFPENTSPTIAIGELKKSPNVKRVEQDFAFPVSYTPNDPYFRKNASSDPKNYYQWNLTAIKAPQAWDITKGGTNVKVAVIDTGLAFENYQEGTKVFIKAPELAGVNILPGLRHASFRCDSNCYCEALTESERTNDNHPVDEFGHGTHVTMTIAQAMNNGSHAAGIAPNVSIIPIRVTFGSNNCMANSDIIAGLDFAKNNGAQVVNLSFGSSSSSEIQKEKINELINAGITIVAASGNDAERNSSPAIGYPAAYPGVIAVGSSRWDNMRSDYSQYGAPISGQNVTLLAPGGQVINDAENNFEDKNNDGLPDGIVQQTIISGQPNTFTQITETTSPDCYNKKCIAAGLYCNIRDSCGLYQGTSMATPHVTAVAALMKSVNPSLNPAQIKNILIQTANKTVIPGYNQNEHGAGLVDAYAALIAAGGGVTPGNCPRGDLGNTTCDTTGVINLDDVFFLVARWKAGGAASITDPLQRRCDLNQDNKVDEKDLSKLLRYWGNL